MNKSKGGLSLGRAMNLFDRLFRSAKLREIERLANTRGSTGGLVKRIDENRELLELLQREAPALLQAHPWMEGWIASNDSFFVQLDMIVQARPHQRWSDFPRPWPGREVFAERQVCIRSLPASSPNE